MVSVRAVEKIDVLVFRYFASPPESVRIPTDGLATARRKRLSENLVAVFDEEHWEKKRGHAPRSPDAVDMGMPFDPDRFNFNKASKLETILHVELCGATHPVLVNLSPLMTGHTVVPLWAENELPQGALGSAGVSCMFELAAKSDRNDFRVGYNSLGGYASVNHLHVHGMYARALDGREGSDGFPVEAVARRPFAITAKGLRVSTLAINAASGHYVGALVFEGGASCVADAAGACVELIASMRLPHNLLVRVHPSPACFLVPRQPQENFAVAEIGCNAAICELCGMLVMQSSAAYERLTPEAARSAFLGGASLPPTELAALLDNCARKLGWWRVRRLAFAAVAGLVAVVAAACARKRSLCRT